jgi:hypothetical protein
VCETAHRQPVRVSLGLALVRHSKPSQAARQASETPETRARPLRPRRPAPGLRDPGDPRQASETPETRARPPPPARRIPGNATPGAVERQHSSPRPAPDRTTQRQAAPQRAQARWRGGGERGAVKIDRFAAPPHHHQDARPPQDPPPANPPARRAHHPASETEYPVTRVTQDVPASRSPNPTGTPLPGRLVLMFFNGLDPNIHRLSRTSR